ncbi:MAG: acyltransferase [Deltaproteobacteria bacterium]|nr:acyltransferase [Deltaproteobacteria bacterium]
MAGKGNDPANSRPYAHVIALDGLRFVAAAIVLVGHCFGVFEIPQEIRRQVQSGPFGIFFNGYGAVHLFFVLSGFCLAGSANRVAKVIDLSQFYVRRVLRIHPPYMYALLIAWLASFFYDVSGGGEALSEYIIKRANVHLDFADLLPYFLYPSPAEYQLGPAWTLVIEMNFSFLLPLMLWITRRSHWMLLLAASCVALFERQWLWGFLDYAFFFALGIAVFIERDRLGRWAERLPAVVWTLVAALGLFVWLSPWTFDFVFEPGFFYSPEGLFASGCGSVILMCLAIFLPPLSRALASRPLAYGGRISYSFYLLHYPVMILCTRAIRPPVTWMEGVIFVLVVFCLTFASAAISFRLIERPSIQLGNAACRFIARRLSADPQVSRLAT